MGRVGVQSDNVTQVDGIIDNNQVAPLLLREQEDITEQDDVESAGCVSHVQLAGIDEMSVWNGKLDRLEKGNKQMIKQLHEERKLGRSKRIHYFQKMKNCEFIHSYLDTIHEDQQFLQLHQFRVNGAIQAGEGRPRPLDDLGV